MVLGSVPAAFAAEATGAVIEVTADKAKPSAGDVVTYTVWLRNASATEGIGAFNFTVNFPTGLTYVADSYEISEEVDGRKGAMGMSTATLDEYDTYVVFNAYGSEGFAGDDLAVLTVVAKVDDGANGNLTVFLSETYSCGPLSEEHPAPDTVDCTISVCNHAAGEEWKNDATNHWHVCGCGQKKSDEAAHTYGAPVVTTEATCTTDGAQVLTCTVCGYEKTEVIKAAHTFDIDHAQVDPTCVVTGIVARHECSVCGVYDIADDAAVIDLVKRTYTIKSDDDEKTVYICSVCSYEYVEEKQSNTEIDSRPDGSVIITTENEDGTVTNETRKDGVTVTTTTDETGAVVSTEVEIDPSAAAQAWIIEVGVSDGTRANDEISREEIVTMLYRYITEVMGVDVASAPIEFSDAANVSDWAQAAMEWAYGMGVMNGNTDGTINPAGATIRSEIAQFFMNFMQNV